MNSQSKQQKEETLPRLCSTPLSSTATDTQSELVNGKEATAAKHSKTNLQELIDNLSTSLSTLNADLPSERLEYLAVLILESMTRTGRVFHNIGHIFDISQKANGVTMLSALFHDVVYYNVDGGFTPTQADLLKDVVSEDENGALKLSEDINQENDPILAMLIDIYGFEAGKVLSPFAGQNEFLSTVVAARVLTEILPPAQIAQIAACIEATIPFRPVDQNGNTSADLLYQRFTKVNDVYNLGMGEEEIVDTIHRSVDLTNRDVGNFASSNTGYFLEQTWKLLPESNTSLRHRAMYSVYDYYMALFKLEKFFSFLDPKVVFRYFRNVPSEETRREMNDQAALNIEIGCGYIRAKLLSIAVLAALAQLTGGDAPMSLFVGDLPAYTNNNEECCSVRLDDQFPPVDAVDDNEEEVGDVNEDRKSFVKNKIYELLAKGRNADSSFDSRSSPMAAFLYRKMNRNNDAVQDSLKYLEAPMMDDAHCKDFLKSLPSDAMREIAHHVALITEHRAEKILNVVEEL